MTSYDQPHRPSPRSSPSSAEEDFADTPPKRSTVTFWLTITALLLLGVVALLGYRAVAVREPGAAVQVQGSESWLGEQVTLTGRDDPSQKYLAYVDASGRYTVTFFVPPGQYALRVGAAETPLFSKEIEATRKAAVEVRLPPHGPGTPPTTAPATTATSGTTSP